MKKVSLLLIAICMYSLNSHAQLTYHSDGTLTLGSVSPFGIYKTNFEGYGFYFTRNYNGTYLELCLGGTAPRLAGSMDQVVFFNSETSTYNSIQVADVLNYSDREAKTNIVPMQDGLQTLMKFRPVTYDWKDAHNGLTDLKTGAVKKNLGFISQDVEEIEPDLVYTDSEGRKLLNYIGIIPILTKSVQELSAQVDSLKAEIEKLKMAKE